MASDNFFTHKYGPLPAWAWGGIAIAAGGLYIWWKNRGAASAASTTAAADQAATGTQLGAYGYYPGYSPSVTNPAPPGTTSTTPTTNPSTSTSPRLNQALPTNAGVASLLGFQAQGRASSARTGSSTWLRDIEEAAKGYLTAAQEINVYGKSHTLTTAQRQDATKYYEDYLRNRALFSQYGGKLPGGNLPTKLPVRK